MFASIGSRSLNDCGEIPPFLQTEKTTPSFCGAFFVGEHAWKTLVESCAECCVENGWETHTICFSKKIGFSPHCGKSGWGENPRICSPNGSPRFTLCTTRMESFFVILCSTLYYAVMLCNTWWCFVILCSTL